MAKILSTSTHLIDTAVGPVAVTESEVEEYDIEDFVHSTVRSQALKLTTLQRVLKVDARLASNRPPVSIDDESVGGY